MFMVAEHGWITREGREPIVYNCEPEVDKPLHAKVTCRGSANSMSMLR